jgi:hypothetical protein
MGTMMFGQDGYHETQKEVCMCVEKEDMHAHYAGLVKDFYETHVPDKAENALELMENFLSKQTVVTGAQPAYKYSRLYYTLHKKYGDNSIVRRGQQKQDKADEL